MRALNILAGIGLALSTTVALAVTQTITVFDGTAVVPTPDAVHPMVAVDSSNRSHVVWSHISSDSGSDRYNIFYKLLAADGTTLIDTTQLSSTVDNLDSFQPQIVVGGTDMVYVSWHTKSNNISLIGLDPSQDDLNGDAAVLGTIQRFAEIVITNADTGSTFAARHPYIDVDSTGNVHILVVNLSSAYCAVYDAAGTVATAFSNVVSQANVEGGGAVVALDANDNMHIATVFNSTSTREISYSMVDCATGSKLIDATTVSTDDTLPSMQPSMVYDAGTVYIQWMDSERGESGCSAGNSPAQSVTKNCIEADNVMQFIALDPSLDDQNGDVASLAAITKVATKSITTPATIESEWYPRMGLTETGELQILFYADNTPETLYGTTVDTNGDIVSAAAVIMSDATTPNRTSQPKASVDNRATVYPEGPMIKMSLRDPAPVPASGSSGCNLFALPVAESQTNNWLIGTAFLLWIGAILVRRKQI